MSADAAVTPPPVAWVVDVLIDESNPSQAARAMYTHLLGSGAEFTLPNGDTINIKRPMAGAAIKAHRCKFCGMPSAKEPSEQTPPPDYCHPEDHESDDTQELKP